MNYKEIISKTLQEHGPTAINMHKIDDHFIMDIDYFIIVNAIVKDLKENGYQIEKINL